MTTWVNSNVVTVLLFMAGLLGFVTGLEGDVASTVIAFIIITTTGLSYIRYSCNNGDIIHL